MVKVGDLIRIKGHPREKYEAKIIKIEDGFAYALWHNHTSGYDGHKGWKEPVVNLVPGAYFYPVKRKPTIIIED